jgi:hypothetical protein
MGEARPGRHEPRWQGPGGLAADRALGPLNLCREFSPRSRTSAVVCLSRRFAVSLPGPYRPVSSVRGAPASKSVSIRWPPAWSTTPWPDCSGPYRSSTRHTARFTSGQTAPEDAQPESSQQHFNQHRPHRARGLESPSPSAGLTLAGEAREARVRRRDLLGGVPHEYQRAA